VTAPPLGSFLMKYRNGLLSVLLIGLLLPVPLRSDDDLQRRAFQEIQRLDTLYANYYRLYGSREEYRKKWRIIQKEIRFLKSLYNHRDYATALELRPKIRDMIIHLRTGEKPDRNQEPGTAIPYDLIRILEQFPRDLPRQHQALCRLNELLQSPSLSAEDKNLLRYLQKKRREEIESHLHSPGDSPPPLGSRKEWIDLVNVFPENRSWQAEQLQQIERIEWHQIASPSLPSSLTFEPDLKNRAQSKDPGAPAPPVSSIRQPAADSSGTRKTDAASPGRYFLSMDVWQSAWGDFSRVQVLLDYLKQNRIRQVNLNPGLPMGPKFYQSAYQSFKPLADQFYRSGIEKINFLYAERHYPIKYYARFLKDHPDLGIDTIVDDSEFIDLFREQFHQNLREVQKVGLYYSAFVTLESPGNSGVSDETRHWVLENVDFPILMSYFSCRLEEQKQLLDPYLNYADHLGRRECVSIAILFGSKKVGREVSCELLLDPEQMRRFLRELDQWGRKSHPSYQGIVIETNLRIPRYPVHPAADRSKQPAGPLLEQEVIDEIGIPVHLYPPLPGNRIPPEPVQFGLID